MTKEEIARKNLMLAEEFDLYVIDNPAIRKKIPRGAYIALLPDGDPQLARINFEAAQRYKDAGEPVVYVRIKKLRPIRSRITSLDLKVEKKRAARDRIENDPRFISRMKKGDKSIAKGKGVRLEDLDDL